MIRTYASAEILFKEAQEMGLDPQWETAHGLFSFQHNDRSLYVFYTKLHLNSQLGTWMCQDKSLTHVLLQKNGLPHIPFCYTDTIADIHTFLDTHQSIIQKPVLGEKSLDTHLINTPDQIKDGPLDTWIFERYIPGTEYRCLVLKGSVIGMQKKTPDPQPDRPWSKTFHNLQEKDWNRQMVAIAIKISTLFHMGLIAVDFILDEDEKIWVLEANSMPGLHYFHHPEVGEKIPVAKMILSAIIEDGLNTPRPIV